MITSTARTSCTFNKSTNEVICNHDYADSRSQRWTGVANESVAEFVGDAPRILYSTGDYRGRHGHERNRHAHL